MVNQKLIKLLDMAYDLEKELTESGLFPNTSEDYWHPVYSHVNNLIMNIQEAARKDRAQEYVLNNVLKMFRH